MSTKGKFESGIATTFDSVTTETVGKLAPVVFYDDFIASSLVVPASGAAESGAMWTKKIVGAGPPLVALTGDINGLAVCTMEATDQAQSAYLHLNDNLPFSMVNGPIFETRLALTVLPTLGVEMQWGLGCAYGVPDNMAYSAWFTADGDGIVFLETDDNATDRSVTSGITLVAGVYHYFKIDVSDVTSIKFFIDGVRVGAATTFPFAAVGANAQMQPFFGGYKSVGAGTGVGTMAIDYVKIWQKRS
jgi:hypothetical protein